MKTKRLIGSLGLLMTAMLLGNTATAQITSVADLEGVYTMAWQGYYWSDFGEQLGSDGNTTVEIRAIEGTDSVEIKGFLTESCLAKALIDIAAMTITLPKQKISETIQKMQGRSYNAIGLGVADWDYETFLPSDSPLTGTISAEKKFSIKGPMVLYQWDDIYHFNAVVEKITLTFESPLPDDGPTEPVRGDLNDDGKVDVSDVNIIINIMLGKE